MSDGDDKRPEAAPPADDPAGGEAPEKPAAASGEEKPSPGAKPGPAAEAAADAAPASDEPAEDDAAAKAAAKAKAAAAAKAKAEAAAKAKAAREAAEAAKPPWERDPVVPEWAEADDDELARALAESHPGAVESARTFAGDLVLDVQRDELSRVAGALKRDHGYKLLVDVFGAHHPDREEAPFEVVYQLHNLEANRRLRLKVATDEATPVPTVSGVWRGADWPEREAWDMFGIRFAGHPDMTRILMWEGFNGHPLRKDFPVEGIDTGSAIYPEYYEEEAGPVAGTGTGWKPAPPPEPPAADEEEGGEAPSSD